MTTKDELESLFEEASNYLQLKTGVPASWIFTNWDDHKSEIVIDKDNEGKELKRYVKITFNNVIDIMSRDQRPKTFTTTSKRLLRKLFPYFEHGATCLEITRTGEGMQTDYEVYPITTQRRKRNKNDHVRRLSIFAERLPARTLMNTFRKCVTH